MCYQVFFSKFKWHAINGSRKELIQPNFKVCVNVYVGIVVSFVYVDKCRCVWYRLHFRLICCTYLFICYLNTDQKCLFVLSICLIKNSGSTFAVLSCIIMFVVSEPGIIRSIGLVRGDYWSNKTVHVSTKDESTSLKISQL